MLTGYLVDDCAEEAEGLLLGLVELLHLFQEALGRIGQIGQQLVMTQLEVTDQQEKTGVTLEIGRAHV